MLYLIHNPSSNTVIRTTNALIVRQHQTRGWHAATSFEELLQEHSEWRPRPERWSLWRKKATEFVSRVCGSILTGFSSALSFAPLYTPSGTPEAVEVLRLLREAAAVRDTGTGTGISAPAERAEGALIGRSRQWRLCWDRAWTRAVGLAT